MSLIPKDALPDIYNRYHSGEETLSMIGESYGVTGSAIRSAVKRYEQDLQTAGEPPAPANDKPTAQESAAPRSTQPKAKKKSSGSAPVGKKKTARFVSQTGKTDETGKSAAKTQAEVDPEAKQSPSSLPEPRETDAPEAAPEQPPARRAPAKTRSRKSDGPSRARRGAATRETTARSPHADRDEPASAPERASPAAPAAETSSAAAASAGSPSDPGADSPVQNASAAAHPEVPDAASGKTGRPPETTPPARTAEEKPQPGPSEQREPDRTAKGSRPEPASQSQTDAARSRKPTRDGSRTTPQSGGRQSRSGRRIPGTLKLRASALERSAVADQPAPESGQRAGASSAPEAHHGRSMTTSGGASDQPTMDAAVQAYRSQHVEPTESGNAALDTHPSDVESAAPAETRTPDLNDVDPKMKDRIQVAATDALHALALAKRTDPEAPERLDAAAQEMRRIAAALEIQKLKQPGAR